MDVLHGIKDDFSNLKFTKENEAVTKTSINWIEGLTYCKTSYGSGTNRDTGYSVSIVLSGFNQKNVPLL